MENKEYLTIKEYATIKGCSTQFVYKAIKDKLADYVEVIDGKKYLKISVLGDEFSKSPTNPQSKVDNQVANQIDNQVANQNANPSSSTLEKELIRVNARNEELIDSLREEIKAKDAQLTQLNEKIISLFETNQRLLENNQQLQLNYQMLLGDGKEKQFVEVDEQGARVVEEPENKEEEKQKKKGFFSWLFNS